jgi:hypothetical protein
MSKKLIQKIEDSMYRIPAEYCTPDKAMVFLAGFTAGRYDAIETIKEFKQIPDDWYDGDAYCVKCKDKRDFIGPVKTSDSGRRIAMGKCGECGTKLNRILGKLNG